VIGVHPIGQRAARAKLGEQGVYTRLHVRVAEGETSLAGLLRQEQLVNQSV
jgi:hypothetical protein